MLGGESAMYQSSLLTDKSMSPRRKINSINQLNPSPQNVERLFHEACFKVKEGFALKKWGFELPDHLH